MIAGKLFIVGDFELWIRVLKSSVLTCVGIDYSFSRKVPWLINQNFQKC